MKFKGLNATGMEIAIVAVVIGGAIWALKSAAGAIGQGVAQVADATVTTAAGVLTGDNVVTQSARTDAYSGTGVVGTVAAATDNMSGGFFSKSGEYIGTKLYDWFH